MLVSLLTLGCPEQLSGGYLYHCRLAELAGDHDAEVEFVPVRLWPDPFTLAHGDVLLSTASRPGSSDALGCLPHDRVTLHLAGRDDVEPAYTPSGSGAASPSSASGSCTTACSTGTASGLPVVGWRAGNLPHLVSDG